jgi:hypothetical protein
VQEVLKVMVAPRVILETPVIQAELAEPVKQARQVLKAILATPVKQAELAEPVKQARPVQEVQLGL